MKKSDNRPAAILVGGGVIALSVARSLSRAGIRVYGLDGEQSEIAYSRHCTRIPMDGTLGPAGWISWLLGEGTVTHGGSVLLPCSDEGLEVLIEHRSELEKNYRLVESRVEIAAAMLDKAKTYELAEKVGVPAPKVFPINSEADLIGLRGSFAYPCALKPLSSHDFVRHFPTLKMFIVRDERELFDAYRRVSEHGIEVLLTELIPQHPEGFLSYYSYLDPDGEPLFHFTKKKLRQSPTAFGLGTYHVTDWNPEVADVGLKFLRGVGLRGIGNLEFMRDPRDGVLKLIECNARFTLTTELVRVSGYDLALLAYNRVLGLPGPEFSTYRRGVYAIRPVSDFLSFRESHYNGETTWGEWLRSLMHWQHFLVFDWRDPMPALVRIIPFWKKQARRILSILRLGDRTEKGGSIRTLLSKGSA